MNNFVYYQPQSVAQALPLLEPQWDRSELLAGGTDLLDRLKEYVSTPQRIVSLTALQGPFREISAIPQPGQPPRVTIGAGVKLADIAESRLLEAYPALTTAAAQIAGPQIRNMGTLGGSLCQRNRCWYYRDPHIQCLLKGGRKCFAHEGENHFHAIFTQGHPCVIVHPSTLAPPLIAVGAVAQVIGPKGTRELPLEKMFQAPSKPDQREHTLAPNEILLSVTIAPTLPPGARLANASYEVKQKATSDWPLVQASVAFALEPASRRARQVRVVLGHVAPTPLLSPEAAAELEGKVIDETTATAAAEAALRGARPLSHNAYKVPMLKAAVKRAVLLAAGFKPYWE